MYIDDISVLSDNGKDHVNHLEEVFKRLDANNIKLRIDKCLFGVSETKYLGFLVDKYGVKPTEKYKQKILNVPEPTTKKELQRFIGLVNYLARFVSHLSDYLMPLTRKLRGKYYVKEFSKHEMDAFNMIKDKIQNTSILIHPDITKPFHIFTDASKNGLGAALCQYDEKGILRPVQFCSKTFTERSKNGIVRNRKYMQWYTH